MPVADYTCRVCGHTIELDTGKPSPVTRRHTAPSRELCDGVLHRRYQPPHIGGGSNGEPPR